jgi:hypothetical protein
MAMLKDSIENCDKRTDHALSESGKQKEVIKNVDN